MIWIIPYSLLVIALYRANKKKKLYYSNYQQCLIVLAESDPKLKEYLEREKK